MGGVIETDRIPARRFYEGDAGGWTDGRLGQAYDLVAEVLKERGVEIWKHALLRAIELEDGNYEQ